MQILLLIAFLCGLPMWPAIAHAHNVSVFAWVENGKVHVESKFSGGRRPKGAAVEVYDADGKKLLEGTTDENGNFSFNAPAAADLKIVLKAGMGHAAEWLVKKSEFDAAADDSNESPNPSAADHSVSDGQGLPEPTPRAGSGLSASQVETIVEQVVEKKLAPIRKMLVDTRGPGPKLSDILGGIGYIFGLMGLAAYFRYRKKQ